MPASKDAMSILDKEQFEIILADFHLLDEDGAKLLKIAATGLNLPVVMMSSNDDPEVIEKFIGQGACYFLVKPIRKETFRMIWQHVIRNRKYATSTNGGDNDSDMNPKSSKRRKINEDDDIEVTNTIAFEKKRMIWTEDLHAKFVKAVNHLGENAVPLKILECLQQMNVEGITREHIASHLQKYRMHLRKQDYSQSERESLTPPRIGGPTVLQQAPALENLQSHEFNFPSHDPQLSRQEQWLLISQHTGSPFSDSGKQFLPPVMGEPGYLYPPYARGTLEVASPLCTSLPSVIIGKEYEKRNKENIPQNYQMQSGLDTFVGLHQPFVAMPQQDHFLCQQQFDQNGISFPHFPEQLQDTGSLMFKATPFDK